MKKLKVLALALMCAVFSPSKADEGMWLLQLMQEQNLADRMKAQGLKMDRMYRRNHLAERTNSDQPPLRLRCHPATQLGRTRLSDRRFLGKELRRRTPYSGTEVPFRRTNHRCDRPRERRYPQGKD